MQHAADLRSTAARSVVQHGTAVAIASVVTGPPTSLAAVKTKHPLRRFPQHLLLTGLPLSRATPRRSGLWIASVCDSQMCTKTAATHVGGLLVPKQRAGRQ